MEKKRYKCDISIQNFAVPRTSQVLSEMKETLDDHEERITTLENGGELPPQPEEPSERYLYISGGNLIARVIDNGEEAEVASEAFTVTLAAFIGDQELQGTQQQVSFAEGDELSKEIEEPVEGDLYVISVSPSSYDGVDWTWEEPEPELEPVDPEEPSERYLYISNGNLIARVIDNGEEAEVAKEAFTVTFAAFIGEEEITETVQQVSFAVGDALSKEIELPEEDGDLYIISVSPSSYDGMDWTWEEPELPEDPVEPIEISERYLYVESGYLMARVVDDGEEAEVASEPFTVTLAAYIGAKEVEDSTQQVSFAEGDELSKGIELPQEGELYVTSVSPSSYDGMDWMWDFPPYEEEE